MQVAAGGCNLCRQSPQNQTSQVALSEITLKRSPTIDTFQNWCILCCEYFFPSSIGTYTCKYVSFKGRLCKKKSMLGRFMTTSLSLTSVKCTTAVQWWHSNSNLQFSWRKLTHSIWGSAGVKNTPDRRICLVAWLNLCFNSGIWVSGPLPTDPIVSWLTAMEPFSARGVHFA